MNALLKVKQATFSLRISERSPFYEHPSVGELSDFDTSKIYFNCDIFFNGKVKAIKSPIFSRDNDNEKFRAYSIFREVVTECITRMVLPIEECPQYKVINGVTTPCNINDSN
jgi:hypothetical protein